jgi:outer membrane receptor protein involved in Fe transport
MKPVLCVLISIILCLAIVPSAWSGDDPAVKLDQIVVTAAKHETLVKDIPASVTIINSEQIELQNLPNGDIGDILRSVPGITTRRAYAPFPSYPNIRGLGSDATVILVNGIPTNWEITQAIPPGNIDRVEIIRGPASALYGANASGGVINIILRQGKQEKSGSLGVGYGNFDTWRLRGDAQGRVDKFSYAIAGSFEDSQGSRVVTNQVNPSITMIDDCDYDKKAVSMNTAYAFNSNSKLSFLYNFFNDRYTRGRPYVGGDWDRHFAAVSLDHEFTDQVSLRAYTGFRYDDLLHLYDKGRTNYDPNKKRYTDYYEIPMELSLTANIGANNRITTGFFYNQQETEQDYHSWYTNALLGENSYKVRTMAGYIQDMWKPVEALTITAGVRYDHWENYDNYFSNFSDTHPGDRTDDNISPKLGIKYNFSREMSVWTNYGMGFKPPTSAQLYDDRTSGGNPRQANPDLKSETTQSWELGVEKWFGNAIQTNVVGFYNYTDDKILSWFDTNNIWVNKNIGGAKSYGVEFCAAWYLTDNWTLDANYTYNLATIDENPSNPSQEGNYLPFSPKHKANIGISYKKANDYTISVFTRYLGDQYTNDNNTTQNSSGVDLMMPDSFVVDLKAVKHFPVSWGSIKMLDLSLGIDNLFDEEYRAFYMYEDPGTVCSAEITLKF